MPKPKRGRLYALSNPEYAYHGPNVYKLGESYDPNERRKSFITPYVHPTEIVHSTEEVSDSPVAEKMLFHILDPYRISPDREFFKCELSIIISVMDMVEQLMSQMDSRRDSLVASIGPIVQMGPIRDNEPTRPVEQMGLSDQVEDQSRGSSETNMSSSDLPIKLLERQPMTETAYRTMALLLQQITSSASSFSVPMEQAIEVFRILGMPIPNDLHGTPSRSKIKIRPKIQDQSQASIRVLSPDIIARLEGLGISGEALKTYEETIKAISLSVFNKGSFEPSDYLSGDNYQRVINYIKADPSPKALITIVVNLLNCCSLAVGTEAHHKYNEFNRSLPMATGLRSKQQYNLRSIGQITWSDLIKKREALGRRVFPMSSLDKVNYEVYHQYLALCIFTMMLPLWPQEWLNTKLIEGLPSDTSNEQYTAVSKNFLNLGTGQLVLSDYRTFKEGNGLRILDLPTDLLKIIRDWYTLTSREYLFKICSSNSTLQIMSPSSFSQMVAKIPFSNGGLTPTLIRKLYISTFVTNGALSDEERDRIAQLMGHSSTAQNVAFMALCSMLAGEKVSIRPSRA